MANTSTRTLRLLSLLQTHRYWPGAELARQLEVSGRTLRRDIDRLRELGYPVEADRGVDGGYRLAAGAAMPPLLLDDDEAVALVVGLQAAAHAGIAGVAESSVRALAKVVQVMPPRLRKRADALRAMTVPGPWGRETATVDPGLLTTMAQACRDTERVRFAYTAHGGEETDRYVEPHRLVSLGRRWYLVGYDLTRHDWRSFRLDRVHHPATTREHFPSRPPPGGDAAAFVRAGIDNLPAPHTVEALIHAPSSTVQAHIGTWGTVEPVGPDQCLLRMTADSLDWPAMALGALKADFDIVSPPELISHLGDWARRFNTAVVRSQHG
ncbi:MAG: YafY family transcriptional regulator [Actinomycetota bacterium]|nr:YafY family transcriptional regulator [Actinomycetota bacterium]